MLSNQYCDVIHQSSTLSSVDSSRSLYTFESVLWCHTPIFCTLSSVDSSRSLYAFESVLWCHTPIFCSLLCPVLIQVDHYLLSNQYCDVIHQSSVLCTVLLHFLFLLVTLNDFIFVLGNNIHGFNTAKITLTTLIFLLTNVFSVDCQIRKCAQFLTEIRFLYLPV